MFQKNKSLVPMLLLCLMIMAILGTQLAAQSMYYSKRKTDVFKPGDGIRVRVWQLMVSPNGESSPASQLTGDYTIDGNGFALFPIIGKLKVTGMKPDRLTQVLTERYSPYLRDPIFYIEPLMRVILQGAFNQPGAYRIVPTGSLWELVELAGGPTTTCDLKKMRVERGGKVVIKNVLGQFERGYSIQDTGLRSGDQLIAPEHSKISFREVRNTLTFIMTSVLLFYQISNYSSGK
ncbi:polysaccharide biosynthesis/export family protein [bacterium]|nr:polysaccharide biosynthesis/export family protein [bacterium]